MVQSLDALVWNFSKAGLEGPTLQSYTREAPGDAETLPPIREGLAEAWRVQGQSRNHLDQQILEANMESNMNHRMHAFIVVWEPTVLYPACFQASQIGTSFAMQVLPVNAKRKDGKNDVFYNPAQAQ